MDESSDNARWKTGYTIALILAVTYIILLGLFTWIFNYSL